MCISKTTKLETKVLLVSYNFPLDISFLSGRKQYFRYFIETINACQFKDSALVDTFNKIIMQGEIYSPIYRENIIRTHQASLTWVSIY